MKHSHDIDTLLHSGNNISLSASEKSKIKQSLLEYAQFHARPRQTAVRPRHQWWWTKRALPIMAAVLIIGFGSVTTYAASVSLPGDTFYAMKVSVLEERWPYPPDNEAEALEWAVNRFATRVAEAQALRTEHQFLSSAMIVDLDWALKDSLDSLSEVLRDDTDNSLTIQDTLVATSDAVSFTRATKELTGVRRAVDSTTDTDVLSETVALHANEILMLLSEDNVSSTEAYVELQLSEIEQEFSEADIAPDTLEEIEQYLQRVDSALAAEQYQAAVQAVSVVAQVVKVQEYVSDYDDEMQENLFRPEIE